MLLLDTIRRIDSGELKLVDSSDGTPVLVAVNNPKPNTDTRKGSAPQTLSDLVRVFSEKVRDSVEARIREVIPNNTIEKATVTTHEEKVVISGEKLCALCGATNYVDIEEMRSLYFVCDSCFEINHLSLCPSCNHTLISSDRSWKCGGCGLHVLPQHSRRAGDILATLEEIRFWEEIAEVTPSVTGSHMGPELAALAAPATENLKDLLAATQKLDALDSELGRESLSASSGCAVKTQGQW